MCAICKGLKKIGSSRFLHFLHVCHITKLIYFLNREQHLIAPALSRSVGTGTHPRLALSRMQMLEQLALSQGINADKQSGLTCRALSECGCSGMHHWFRLNEIIANVLN